MSDNFKWSDKMKPQGADEIIGAFLKSVERIREFGCCTLDSRLHCPACGGLEIKFDDVYYLRCFDCGLEYKK